MENVEWADWSPDGSSLAIVRYEQGRHRLEYPAGKLLYTARRMDRPHSRLAQGKLDRADRSPHARRRRRIGRHRRSRRQEDCPLHRMGQHSGTGLGAGRRGSMVHRHPHRRRPLALCGRSLRQAATAGARSRRADHPRCRPRRKCSTDARQRPRWNDRPGSRRRERTRSRRGSTGPRRATCQPTAPPCCLPKAARAAAPSMRCSCARPTARRPSA